VSLSDVLLTYVDRDICVIVVNWVSVSTVSDVDITGMTVVAVAVDVVK